MNIEYGRKNNLKAAIFAQGQLCSVLPALADNI